MRNFTNTPSTSDEQEKIISLIKEAFSDVPVPSKMTLHVAEAHDDYDYDHDTEHRKKDHLGHWMDIPETHFLKCQNALAHLDKEGIQYYLPALMIWVLKNYKEDYWIISTTLYTLGTNDKNSSTYDYNNERYSLFTKKQIQACIDFLKYLVTHDPHGDYIDTEHIKKALELRWLPYIEKLENHF